LIARLVHVRVQIHVHIHIHDHVHNRIRLECPRKWETAMGLDPSMRIGTGTKYSTLGLEMEANQGHQTTDTPPRRSGHTFVMEAVRPQLQPK